MSNICKVSVPIPILLPTETDSGIEDTYISVVNPTVDDGSIVEIPDALKEVTPTVWLPFNWDNVDANPEIDITSPSEKVWNGKTVKFKLFAFFQLISVLLIVVVVVLISTISLPFNEVTLDISPVPSVLVLSKDKLVLTL